MPDIESATERGERVLKILARAGKAAGLETRTEYPVVGGRIDLVWLWRGPEGFPALLPLVGFEIESSWRTRKHIKGDYLNLLDLQPALGVIVLLGDGAKVESTRVFARAMLDHHPGRMVLWSESEVLSIATKAGREVVAELLGEVSEAQSTGSKTAESPDVKSGKYRAFSAWLATQTKDRLDLSFSDVEQVIGFPLPASARAHNAYWSGGQPGSTIGNAIREAGWRARNVNMTAERVTLERI